MDATPQPTACQAMTNLPGLEHLQGHVGDWDVVARTLSYTASTLADSMGAATGPLRNCTSGLTSKESSHGETLTHFAAAPSAPVPLPVSLPPVTRVTASQLKPGRLFIVANLQGAYYTLVELLSRHKFDFRQDNLMHLGNLVAPPVSNSNTPSPISGAVMGEATTATSATSTTAGALSEDPPRRCRNSAPLLKLVRRHCAGLGASGGGPMGVNECLVVLAAARANRLRMHEEQERKRQVWQAQGLAQREGPAGNVPGTARGIVVQRSALSLQLAACATVAAQPRMTIPPARPQPQPRFSGAGPCPNDSSSSDNSDSDDSEDEEELVAAPMTPYREEQPPSSCAGEPTGPAATALASGTLPTHGSTGAAGYGRGNGNANGVGLEDVDIAQLLSLPGCVLVEPYGIALQHAGPAAGSDSGSRYHTVFSHRRAGGGGGGSGQAGACSTGLASCRHVVRCAVLPPLAKLQRRSPGFVAKLAAGQAPSRDELLLEVVEEPLSPLDLGPPAAQAPLLR